MHRALITGLKLGRDGLSPEDTPQFEDTAEQITATERRATLAERDSTDRYLALYLQHRVGELFTGPGFGGDEIRSIRHFTGEWREWILEHGKPAGRLLDA